MSFKFLRQTGEFAFPTAADIGISTSTTTSILGFLTNSIAGPISLNTTGTTFDGPTVAQGSSGIWYADGTITILQGGVAGAQHCKLWDGTNTIAAGLFTATATFANTVSLSGAISAPAGNLRISVVVAAAGTMLSTTSAYVNASTLTAIRIG